MKRKSLAILNCIAACSIVAGLEHLGLGAVPMKAYVSEEEVRSVNTVIVSASDNVESAAIVRLNQLFLINRKPIFFERLPIGTGLQRVYKAATFWQTSSIRIATGIAGWRLGIPHDDVPNRHNGESQRVAVIVKTYVRLVGDIIYRESRWSRAIWVYQRATAQHLLVNASRHFEPLFIGLPRIEGENEESQDFEKESRPMQFVAEVFSNYALPALRAVVALTYLCIAVALTAFGLSLLQFRPPRDWSNRLRNATLLFGLVVPVVSQACFWRFLDLVS